jgi:hypothetical protein
LKDESRISNKSISIMVGQAERLQHGGGGARQDTSGIVAVV